MTSKGTWSWWCVAAFLGAIAGCNGEASVPGKPDPNDDTTGGGIGGEGGAPIFGRRAGGDGVDNSLDQRGGVAPQNDFTETDPLTDLTLCDNHGPADVLQYFMSADDSNSMASPAIVREILRSGAAPSPDRIRTYEMLNFYNARYALPKADNLGVHVALQPISSEGAYRYRLQVGVQAPPQEERPPYVVTLVADTSGSLAGPGIDRLRAIVSELTNALVPGDVISVVTWNNQNTILLDGYTLKGGDMDKSVLSKVRAALVPAGGSDLHTGLATGYALAKSHKNPLAVNRVVLLSDGGANLGVLDEVVIAEGAKDADEEGIYLVGVGIGPSGGYTDDLMNAVTDAGKGAYVYVDDAVDAPADLFKNRFDEVMGVGARNVQVRLDLPAFLEIEHFYGEKYSTDASLIEAQHLAPGDVMIFNETLEITDASLICGNDTVGVHVAWETPIAHVSRQIDLDPVALVDLYNSAAPPQMVKANAVISYAEALRSGDPDTLAAASLEIETALGDPALANDADLIEIADLIQSHPSFPQ